MKSGGLVGDFWSALFGSVEPENFRDRLLGGVSPEIEAPSDDPYARSYEEIISIQQKGARGFRTFDINPFTINQEDYPCTILNNVLGNLFGFEDGLGTFGFGVDTNTAPFWRTISIDANATWVRIEYLPDRVNDFARGLPGIGPAIEPQTIGPVFPDTGTGNDRVGANWPGKPSMDQQIIIQFDDTNGSPILAKHGDSFRIPFNTLYVTFKMWSPRFRITCGYNTDMVTVDDRMLATRPAFAGGRGILNNPTMHYVPFCLTSGDITGVEGGAYTLTIAASPKSDILIRNLGNSANQNIGQCLFWIHSFNVAVNVQSAPAAGTIGNVTFSLLQIRVSGGLALKRLASLTIPLSEARGFNGSQTLEFVEPIRVNLRFGETVVLRATTNFATLSVFFVLRGYVYGMLQGQTNPAGVIPITPFDCTLCVAEDSYPMDYLYISGPGGIE